MANTILHGDHKGRHYSMTMPLARSAGIVVATLAVAMWPNLALYFTLLERAASASRNAAMAWSAVSERP